MKSDADRLFEVIFTVIHDYLPDMRAEHKLTLAQMVTGILRSGNVQFHEIAHKLRYKGKKPSLAGKFRRFVRNKNLDVDVIPQGDAKRSIFPIFRNDSSFFKRTGHHFND